MSTIDTNADYGVVTEPATLTIQRLLPGPIERVWSYLTESDLRRKWLAAGDMEMSKGSGFELTYFVRTIRANRDEIVDSKCISLSTIDEDNEEGANVLVESRLDCRKGPRGIVALQRCEFLEMQESLREGCREAVSTDDIRYKICMTFESRIRNESNMDFAKRMNVTEAATGRWARILKKIALDYMDSDLVFRPRSPL